MTGGSGLFDHKLDCVLITVGSNLNHLLNVSGRRAFTPKGSLRSRPVPGVAGLNRLGERLFIHVSEHQQSPGLCIGRDSRDQAVAAEFWGENGRFLYCLANGVGGGECCVGHRHESSSAQATGTAPLEAARLLPYRRGAVS